MTATEILRRMLDERGVEWETDRSGFRVMWGKPVDEFHDMMQFKAVDNALPNGGLNVHICGFTPEQAIAATLGRGECHNISKVMDEHGQARFACSECGAWIDSRMLWNPECRNSESPWVKDCKLNFCPNCGAKIVDPTTNDVDGEVTDG